MAAIVQYALGVATGLSAIALFVFFNLERIEKWIGALWRVIDRIGLLSKRAHKEYVRHDLQGSVNHFLKQRLSDMPGFEAKRVRLEWIDDSTSRDAFLKNDEVIVRIKRSDSNAENFVRATSSFVARSLLFRSKRYLSGPQAQATDLFVTTKILEAEKPEYVDFFLEEYLHSGIGPPGSLVSKYFDRYTAIAGGGFFFPIYLQELHFLGQKIFGSRQDAQIIVEVDALIDHLRDLAEREVGDDSIPLDFVQQYCRFGVVIVGKPQKLAIESSRPYINYIRNSIVPSSIETVYVLGVKENEDVIREVCAQVESNFTVVEERRFSKELRYPGRSHTRDLYLAVLRSTNRELYIPSEN